MVKLLEKLAKVSSGLLLGLSLFLASLGTSLVVFASCPQDFNGDGEINQDDLSALSENIGQTVPPAPEEYDLNSDGQISGADLDQIAGYIGESCYHSDSGGNGDNNGDNHDNDNDNGNSQNNNQNNSQDNNQNTNVNTNVGGNQDQHQDVNQNQYQDQHQDQSQSQSIGDITQNVNQNVNVTVTAQANPAATPSAVGAAVPQKQPVTGVAGWTLISMSSLGPLGLLLRRYGFRRLTEVEEIPQNPLDIWVLRENLKISQRR